VAETKTSPVRILGREDKCHAVIFLKLSESRNYLLYYPKQINKQTNSVVTVGDASLQINLILYFRSCTLNVSNYQAEVLYLEYCTCMFLTRVPFNMKKIRTVISAQENFSKRGVQRLTDGKKKVLQIHVFFLSLFCTGKQKQK